MKRIVVTGVTGFVGKYVVAPLRARGFEVHALVRSEQPLDGADPHVCDLSDKESLQAVIARIRPTHMLHLAWSVPPGQFWTATDNLDWVATSLRLYRAFAAQGGKRFVAAGTCAEYDWSGVDALVEEVSPCTPATFYGVAKDSLHRVLAGASRVDKVSFGWGRVFFSYGPGEKPGRLMSDVIRHLLSGQPAETTLGGQLRDFMHVADTAAAFAALCDSAVEGPVNIASGKASSLRDIIVHLGDLTGRPDLLRIGARPERVGDPSCILASTARLSHEVGFKPEFDLATGLADAVAWWRKQGSSGA